MNLFLLAVVLVGPPQAPVPPQGPPVDEARVRQIVRDELKIALAALEAKPARPPAAPAAALPQSYAAFYRTVAGGASGVLFVGRPVPTGFSEYRTAASVATLDGFGPGVYQCDLVGGKLMMVPRAEAGSLPAFATPVRNLIYQFAPRGSCANGNCPR